MINLESKFSALGRNLKVVFFQCPMQCGIYPSQISVNGHPAFVFTSPIMGTHSMRHIVYFQAFKKFFMWRAKAHLPVSSIHPLLVFPPEEGFSGCILRIPRALQKGLLEPAHPQTQQLCFCILHLGFHLRFHLKTDFTAKTYWKPVF